MKNIDVLILIEGKARELESACLLEEELQRRGLTAKIRSVYPNKEKLSFIYSAKVVITPWGYNERDMKFLSCFYMNRNGKILNLHHEQYSGNDDENVLLPVGENAKNIFHVSWGEKFTNELLSVGCIEDKICQAGNIRLDFLKKRFSQMSLSKEELASEFNLDINKKWVMFIANGYHLANETKLKNMSTIDKFVREKAKLCSEIRLDFFAYADKYLNENNDAIFIYRPHPVLSALDMQNNEVVYLSNKYKGRFVCIYKYSIKDWIFNCDLSISIHSTSGIESYVANRPFYLFRTKEFYKRLDYTFYEDYSYVIKNYQDLVSSIKECSGHAVKWDKIKEYYDTNADEYSYEKICDYVEHILEMPGDGKVMISGMITSFFRFVAKDILIWISKTHLGNRWVCFKGKKDNRYRTILASYNENLDEEECISVKESIRRCLV